MNRRGQRGRGDEPADLPKARWSLDPETGKRIYGNPVWGDLRVSHPELFEDIAQRERWKRQGRRWNGYMWVRGDGSCQMPYEYSLGEDDEGDAKPTPVLPDDSDWGM